MTAARFCLRCGHALEPLPPDHRDAGVMACTACGYIHYENPPVTVMGWVERDGRFLTLRRAIEPEFGAWDTPGGFVDLGEHPEDAVRREVREETGLRVEIVRVLGVYSEGIYATTGKRTIDIAYLLRPLSNDDVQLSDESSDAQWLPLAEFPTLAFPSERKALEDMKRGPGPD